MQNPTFSSYFCLSHPAFCSRKTLLCFGKILLCSEKILLCSHKTPLCSGKIASCSSKIGLCPKNFKEISLENSQKVLVRKKIKISLNKSKKCFMFLLGVHSWASHGSHALENLKGVQGRYHGKIYMETYPKIVEFAGG